MNTRILNKSKGLYTVEGAFTIVIFTILFMMLLLIIPIIRTESVIQAAINQTAMELSEYSYAVCSSTKATEETGLLKSILQDVKREAVGFATGSALCQKFTKSRVDEKALRIIDGGYSGINFAASNILGDGETITVVAIYKVNVDIFGLVDKTLTICQKAQTKAWLPYDAEKLSSTSSTDSSIWSDTNFVRGKYFVETIKKENLTYAVKAGQGIDLYNKNTGKATEIYSLNIFSSSYSYNPEDLSDAKNYSPTTENLKKQFLEYARSFESDISKCGNEIVMEDGSHERLNVKSKEIIVVLPEEAKENENFVSLFGEIRNEISNSYDINIEFRYMEEAL